MASFSRPNDFTKLVSIPLVGTLGFLIKHYFQYQNVESPISYSTWFNHFWMVDTSLWAHVFCFSIAYMGVAAAVYCLRLTEKVMNLKE